MKFAVPVIGLLVAVGVTVCGGDRDAASSSGRGGASGTAIEIHAVQVAAFADSAAATRLSDSLTMAGWQSYVAHPAGGEETLFRVRVSPSVTAALTKRVAFALRGDGLEALAVVDTEAVRATVEVIPVNAGPHGATARVRWLISPNGRSLLLVHDPAGVEAEALPDAFVFASEVDTFVYQRGNVWDVVPSPSWTRIAFGEAFTFSLDPAALDVDTAQLWMDLATASGMAEDSVRANSYLVSGMTQLHSYSRPVILELTAVDTLTGKLAPVALPLFVSGGWRVRWTPDSTQLVLGDAPIRALDDSPPRNWIAVEIESGLVRGSISQSKLVPPDWRLGPALDVSVPIDLQSERSLRLEGARITSSAGWIRRDGQVVGPGVALAATRDGLFIAALAPRVDAKDYESPLEPVVYRVTR